ncbi:MAG: L,D-transpeptidase [Bacteroidales bacterium]|nr:L,D-transpeptidase [Bacteroidales bacterium]
MTRHFPVIMLLCLLACGNSGGGSQNKQQPKPAALFTYDKDGLPLKKVYDTAGNKENCFIVISKVHPEHLSVYEAKGRDTVLLAVYPACVARDKGQKEKKGDNKTPESYPGKPFSISQIKDAHNWTHDFGDGRGPILAYGNWFLRLDTPRFGGIGIHGSTGNRESIKTGRGSEGCIRLLDEDIIHLKENYVWLGMPVIILPEGMGPLPFEAAALKKRARNEGAQSPGQ